MYGAPNNVTKNDIQLFLTLKQNAQNFAHNTKLENRQKERIEAAGAFRSPIDNGGRSYKPAYGKLKQLERVDDEYVYEKGVTRALERGESDEPYKTLKHHAIPATAGKFLTDLVPSQRKLLGLSALLKKKTQNQALELENILLREGEISVKDVPKRIKSLSRVKTRVGASGTAWIKAHKDRFVIQDGVIRLKNHPSQGSRPPIEEEMGPQIPPPAPKPKPIPKAIAKTKKPSTIKAAPPDNDISLLRPYPGQNPFSFLMLKAKEEKRRRLAEAAKK